MSGAKRSAASIAATQHGVISAQQAAGAGLSVGQIRTLVESGMWTRRWREVYAIAGAPTSFEADVMVACLAGGPLAMACRGTVARLLGVGRPYFDKVGVELAVPRGAAQRSARAVGATVHVFRHLGEDDRQWIGPVPATSAARLVVDLLDFTPVEGLYAVADDVLQRRWCTPDEIRRRWSATRVHHRDVLEAVLLPWVAGPRAGSPKELSLCRVLQLHGLPRPVRQHRLWIPGRSTPRYLDLAYPEARIAPEYDGRREHGVREWERDAAREDELGRVGWVRLPAGRSDLTEPGASAYCDGVRAAIGARTGRRIGPRS
jgi:hypothetical protein